MHDRQQVYKVYMYHSPKPQSGFAHLAKRGVSYGRGPAQGPQKLWGKWCKILHSRHLLEHILKLQIAYFFTEIFPSKCILFIFLLQVKSSLKF